MKKISLFLILILIFTGCLGERFEKYSESKDLLDTKVTITVYSTNEEKANNAIKSGFEKIEALNSVFNIYDNKSEAYILNEKGQIISPSRDLKFVISRAIHYSNITGGAFDISVQPILDLYTYSFGTLKRPPSIEEISSALEFVGYEKITLNESGIFLNPGMKLTYGAIAKGYIIDEAYNAIKDQGMENILVDIGGDMRGAGDKNVKIWQVALQNPRNPTDFITIIPVSDSSVATSGDYERYFINKSVHHIINPKTGLSSQGVISSTVISTYAIDADALATSLMVLGAEEGIDLIEKMDDTEALIINEEKKLFFTPGFPIK